MNNVSNFLKFSINTYGQITKVSPTLSKGRCRIFYKYGNRNGTYITEEFAEKLIKTLPYTPVKGIYDTIDEDYTDHGKARSEGRIYGIVPYEPNFAWETHVDDDGVERTYACCDVLIYTALYEEAEEIFTKSQSMELYDKSIVGHWERINNIRYYVFDEGCFLGLQALGDETEPCFEGASFYSLYDDLKKILEDIKTYSLKIDDKGGEVKMATINFKMSDSDKFEKLWSLLNTNYTEEGNWTIDCVICDVYDEYCVIRNYADNSFERVRYNKTEEDTIEIVSREACYIMDLSESEKTILEKIQQLNNGTYEKADEVFASVETLEQEKSTLETEKSELAEKNSEFEQKILDANETISTLETERDEIKASYDAQTETLNSLNTELDGLKQYKLDVENKQKEDLFAQYSSKLDAGVIEEYKGKASEYTVDGLDRELAYVLVKSNPTVLSQDSGEGRVPKVSQKTGIEAILDNYKK